MALVRPMPPMAPGGGGGQMYPGGNPGGPPVAGGPHSSFGPPPGPYGGPAWHVPAGYDPLASLRAAQASQAAANGTTPPPTFTGGTRWNTSPITGPYSNPDGPVSVTFHGNGGLAGVIANHLQRVMPGDPAWHRQLPPGVTPPPPPSGYDGLPVGFPGIQALIDYMRNNAGVGVVPVA